MPISDSLPTPVRNAIAQAYRSVDDKLAKMAAAAEAADHSRRSIPRPQDYDEDDGPQSTTGRLIQGFRDQLRRGNPVDLDLESISAIVDVLQNKTAIDDRKFLLENLLTFMARISPTSKTAEMLQERVIRLLYLDLPHPPLTAVGDKYAFRTADGSNNNINLPDLGKANTPYVRSVQQCHPLPVNELPDPELIWQTLMKRDKVVEHPSGLSSCFFAFANTVIHTCFNTNPRDYNINQTSSYVDLSSLYGNNIDEQHAVRDMNGYGLLHPDTWSDVRLGLASPASSVFLILFNRNHNYIAQRLLAINERSQWSNPPPSDPAAKQLQDDQIFNTARLVNCGFYVSIVLGDYLSAILGLVREGSSFSLDLMKEVREDSHDFIRRGEGNANSVEFNLLYRWHSPTSTHDVEWLEPLFKKLFNNKPFDQITPLDFRNGVAPTFIQAMNTPPKERNFFNLTRGPDGRFPDDQLASILMDATESAACMFKARGVPEVLRIIEIMGIQAGRRWGVCSLNEFRKFLGMKPYKEFIEWNSDPEIAMAAEKLYETTDNLELHVGLVCEESKPVIPGAGLCPSYTTSRAILADACALTRGDRHLTMDYTPYNLTAWGFRYAARDTTNASFGGMLGTLFQNTLPDHFPADSVYTQFPLMTPKALEKFMTDLGLVDRYTYTRPLKAPAQLSARDGGDVRAVLGNGGMWKTPYVDNARMITKGEGLMMWLNDPVKFAREKAVVEGVVLGGGVTASGSVSGGAGGAAVEKAKKYYYEKTLEFMKERSYSLSRSKTRSVDVVRDVIMAVPLHWAAYELAGLPLKSLQLPYGSLYEEELYDMLKDIYNFVFLDLEPAKRNINAAESKTHVEVLTTHIKKHLRSAGARGIVETIYETIVGRKKDAVSEMMRGFWATGKDDEELANDILSVLVGISTEYSQALTNVLNFYLEPENEYYLRDICQLARSNKPEAANVLEGYVREALRYDPPITRVIRRAALPGASGNFAKVDRGDIVFLNLTALNDASSSPAAAASASASASGSKSKYNVDPSRPKTAYTTSPLIFNGLSEDFLYKTMAQVLRAIFSLNNVRRGPGKSGVLKRHKESVGGIDQWMYLDEKHRPTPWAKSMTVFFDQ